MQVETIEVLGQQIPMNTWGYTTLLLSSLQKEGHLPECFIYTTEDESKGYFINGVPVGHTLEEVTSSVWKMVKCYRDNGYLFEG